MKRMILSLLVFGGLAITACSGRETATPEETPQASPTTGDVLPAIAINSDPFDLGGPCLAPGVRRGLALTGVQEDELRSTGNWDALVEGAKQDVRTDCQIPYRWERLFNALVGARRYAEALQVLAEMATRQFPMPHAVLSRADSAFLTSTEFKESALGVEYAALESQIQTSTRLAEAKLMSMPPNNPPNPHRAPGACPFECCTYREWKTTSAVQLVESIRSGTVVAQVPADTTVEGMTGEVLVEPQPYAVLWNVGNLKAGDVIFFLDYLGEGHVNYWYNGQLNPDLGLEYDSGIGTYTYETCGSNGGSNETCSLRKLQPEKEFLNEWWVQIKTSDGHEGWTLNTGQFSNVDACG